MSNNNQIKNGFIKLFCEYFEYLKPFLEKDIIDLSSPEACILDHFRYKKVRNKTEAEKILTDYNHIKEKINDIDGHNWFMIIHDFIGFISFTEKSLLYLPSGIEIIIADNIRLLKMNCGKDNKYNITIKFEKSKLPTPGSSESSILSNFINNESATVYFIDIQINNKDSFKFISYEIPKFDNLSDDILLYKVKKDLSEAMMVAFDDVLDEIMNLYHHNNIYIRWKEVLRRGLWIR